MTKSERHKENLSNYNHGKYDYKTYQSNKEKIDNMGMLVIKCKSGSAFAACVEEYADDEWFAEELYYKKQGCTTGSQESVEWSDCKCEHCETLIHKFEYTR